MFAPGVPQVIKEFGIDSKYLASFVISVYVLGYAFGPLLIAPMSELYGRIPVYLVTSFLSLVFSLACAWSIDIWMLTLFRFLAVIAGSCPITVGSGTIADTFIQEERGRVMGLWPFSILFRPSLGPVAGSYVAEAYGWRSDFYILAACTGIYLILALIFQDETFPPLLLERKYGFNRSLVGVVFLGLGIGQFISPAIFSRLSDSLLQKLASLGEMKPEYRLPLLWPGAVLIPFGFLVYGWSAEYQVHFMVPILGTALVGAGMIWTFLPIGIYVVDAYTSYAASATAATTVLRSIGGVFIPLAGGSL
ncbi:MFS domain-containing protein [Fusarium sp. Ph1]|nr:MFS domain-containing protein [Fusarium sp. Ph1]